MSSMLRAEIVMIGSELLLGQIVDSNAAHIAQVLAENGIHLYQKTTVGDNQARMVRALNDALERADVVLTSGGLGPTEDDLTREAVADVFGVKLEFRQRVLDDLLERFAWIRGRLTENNNKQAYVPEGAVIIPNPNGTAPGFRIGDDRGEILCMPGVPFELKAMLSERIVPYLREAHGIAGVLHSRVLKVCGVGESRVDDAIGDLIKGEENPTVGVLANPEWVRIRITARARDILEAESMIDTVDAKVRERLPGMVMGQDDATLEGVLDALLQARAWRIAVGETHTGGMIAQRLTAAGAESFVGAEVVRERTDAAAWTRSLRERFHADAALAVVGDVTEGRAVIVFACPDGMTEGEARFARVDRVNQIRSSVAALEHVRRYLTNATAAL